MLLREEGRLCISLVTDAALISSASGLGGATLWAACVCVFVCLFVVVVVVAE